MRIAVLCRHFVVDGGGAEHYAIAITEQLVAGNEIHVFAQKISHHHPGVTYHLMPWGLARPRWVNQLMFAYWTWRATHQGFDIVYSHENLGHGNVQAIHVLPMKYGLYNTPKGKTSWWQKLRVATSPRLLTYLCLERARFSLYKGKCIIATSNTLMKAIQNVYPETAHSVEVINPGVLMPDTASNSKQELCKNARKILRLPLEGQCILFVGQDFRKKGLPALIQACAQLANEFDDLYLAVAGNPAQRAPMQDLARELGIANRVHFLGALSDMDHAYRAANYLVHPTLQDSYAMVVLEAMAYGLPVVVSASPYCGIADDLTNGVNALLIDNPHDTHQICQHLRSLITDQIRTQVLIDNGYLFAAKHTWHVAAAAHRKLFSEVLA